MENLTIIIKALSDANRLKILSLLNKKALCVCEIKALLSLAQPTISTHLKVLVNAKLIKPEKQGTWIIYHIIFDKLPNHLKQIVASSLDYLTSSPEIKGLLKKQKTLNLRPKCN
jgi:ArsR family transcriptional regulator, arsenate/arsenite/antimonite-responsive transcriptional repressor